MKQRLIWILSLLPVLLVNLTDPASLRAQGQRPEGAGNGNPPENGPDKPNKGKPAKVFWEGCRLTMSAFDEQGMAQVSFTPNMNIESAVLWVSGSLSGVLGFSTSSFPAVAEAERVDIDVTLITTPCEAGRTIGGTAHVRAGGRTLARPCAVSLKRDACDENGETEGGTESGEPGADATDDDDGAPITWQEGGGGAALEELTEAQFDGSDKATVEFCSTDELAMVNMRLTRSLEKCLMLVTPDPSDPTAFPIAVDAGDCVPLTFMLKRPAADFTSSCGGTVHVRNDGSPPKTFAEPLSVNLFEEEEAQEEVAPSAIVNSASFAAEPVAPGQIVSIFGLGLGPEELSVLDAGDDGVVDEDLGGTLVLFDGIPAPLLSSFRGQINTIVPVAVKGDDVELRVLHLGKQSAPFPVPLGPAAPALFTLDGSGSGQAAAINTDGTLNGPSNAARRGTVIQLYGTGGGPTITALGDGVIAGSNAQLAATVTVLIDGEEAGVDFVGVPAGLVNGVIQLNARIPHGIGLGPRDVTVIIEGIRSSGGVTIAIK